MDHTQVSIMSYNGMTPTIADNVYLAPGVRIIGDVHIEEGCSIWFNTVIRGDVNHIRIGARTNIQDNTVIHVSSGGHPTIIGADVTIGHSAIIHACTILPGSIIGMGATILDGAVIGARSLIGARALITQNQTLPEESLILGAPAKVKRRLSAEEIESLAASADAYFRLAAKYSGSV